MNYLSSSPKQKHVYHRTSSKQPYTDNLNYNIELPQVQPITLKPTHKQTTISESYHHSTIQNLLLNVNNEIGWTDPDISIFSGLWQLETIRDHEQMRKQSEINTAHTCNSHSCTVCYVQTRMSKQSRILNANKNDCSQNNINMNVRPSPVICNHSCVLYTHRLNAHTLHDRGYTNTYDPTLNSSVDYSFGGLRDRTESILQ